MRRSLLLVLLLAALAGCATAPPGPGELLYVSTFDAYNYDWNQFEGSLESRVVGVEADPALQIMVEFEREGTYALMNHRTFSDFDLVMDVQPVDGAPENSAFGVIFRHQDRDNFYVFLISSDGFYQVKRRLAGDDTGGDNLLSDWPWEPSPAIRQGSAPNTLRVIAQGDTFTFMVNDEILPLCPGIWQPGGRCCMSFEGSECIQAVAPVFQLVDDSISAGYIGAAVEAIDDGDTENNERVNQVIQFDNVILCGPHPTPPVPFVCSANPPGAPTASGQSG